MRRPTDLPGRATANPRALTGLARCVLCGSSYQLETSGKPIDGATYSYCSYNAARRCAPGSRLAPGFRARVEDLDGAVLAALADTACTAERAKRLARRHHWPPPAEVVAAWCSISPRERASHPLPSALRFHAIARGSAMECGALVDVCAIAGRVEPAAAERGKVLLVRIVSMLTRECR